MSRIVADIEDRVRAEDGELPEPSGTITVRQRRSIGIALIARSVFTLYPRRTLLCFALFIGQAFLYNAFFFTFGDTLTTFLGVKQTGWYIAIFAASNFLGALLLSPLFDTVGRVRMIAGTYLVSGHLACHNRRDLGLADCGDAYLVRRGDLLLRLGRGELGLPYGERDLPAGDPGTLHRLLLCGRYGCRWHRRAAALRCFDRERLRVGDITKIALGYFIGAALMIAGGVVEAIFGVNAERQALEDIATPLTVEDATEAESQAGRSA